MDLQADMQIAVPFTIPAQNGLSSYTDQLFYSSTDYATLTQDQLIADQQARYNNWVTVMTTPAPENTSQTQPLQAQIDALQQALTSAQEQLAQIQQAVI